MGRVAYVVYFGVLALTACGAPPSDSDPCEAQRGFLEVCATYFGGVADGSALVRLNAEDDVPLEALFGADGCTTIELSSGEYEWAAAHASDSCISGYLAVEIGACQETTEVTVELGNFCMDGR